MDEGETRSFKNAQDAKAFRDASHAEGYNLTMCLACDKCGVKAPFMYIRPGDDNEQVMREIHELARQVGFEGDICAACSGRKLPEGCMLVIIGGERRIGFNDSKLGEYKEGFHRRRNAS